MWTESGKNTYALTNYKSDTLEIHFQDGPIQEFGINGATNEEVIQVLLDRLNSLNQPPYNCRENSLAITHLEESLLWLNRRTQNRISRNVEGTREP